MASNTYFKCPRCGSVLGSVGGLSSRMRELGPETMVCPHCFQTVKTGAREWVDMPESQHQLIWVNRHIATALLHAPVVALMVVAMLFAGVTVVAGDEGAGNVLPVLLVAVGIPLWAYLVWRAHRVYKEEVSDSLQRKPNPN